MDWYPVGIAAVCGALGGVVGALVAMLFKNARAKQVVSTIVTVTVFMNKVSGLFSRPVVK